MSASLNSDILEEGLKMELRMLYHNAASLPPGVTFETCSGSQVIARIIYRVGEEEKQYRVALKRNDGLIADLLAIENSRDWLSVRRLGLLDYNEEIYTAN